MHGRGCQEWGGPLYRGIVRPGDRPRHFAGGRRKRALERDCMVKRTESKSPGVRLDHGGRAVRRGANGVADEAQRVDERNGEA